MIGQYHIFDPTKNDALPLEYKLKNRHPTREVDISNFIGDAALERFLRVDERHLQKKFVDIVSA